MGLSLAYFYNKSNTKKIGAYAVFNKLKYPSFQIPLYW